MNDTEQANGVLPPNRRRLPGIVLLLGVFLAGMLCGGGLAVLHVMHRIREGMHDPARRTEHVVERMSRQLDLTPEQQARIRSILQAQDKELANIRKESWPKVVARMERTEQEIGELLKPDQRERWRAMIDDLRRHCLPGGMRQPRGGPSGIGHQDLRRGQEPVPGRGRPEPGPAGKPLPPRPDDRLPPPPPAAGE